ncbi:MAG: hypothetical protein AB7F88_00440 [Pyrinomonadaceae bacterium]
MKIQLSKLTLGFLLPAIISLGLAEINAQTLPKTIGSKAVKKRPPKKVSSRPAAESLAKPLLSPQSMPPVKIVNLAEPDYLSGEASVTVNPKQPTVIRLGLAQNAVSIIEFPASDGIYYIHEGNPKFASVFQSPTKETDRSITVYPGESFLPGRDGNTASAISLQMRSGLVLILEFVPVADLRKHAHRCVITYDREMVVSARRTAGLAFDLGGEATPPVPMNSRAVSKLVAAAPSPTPVVNEEPPVQNPAINSAYANLGNERNGRGKGSDKKRTDAEISVLANKRLAESIRDPKKHLGQWSKMQHGLELAVSRITELDPESRLVIVVVRNVTASNLRLVPGSPELQIQTTDASGNGIQTTRLEANYIESTTLEGLVQPGSTVYYALVYKAPILGTNQSVRVLIAHRDAADAPLTSNLGDPKSKE